MRVDTSLKDEGCIYHGGGTYQVPIKYLPNIEKSFMSILHS